LASPDNALKGVEQMQDASDQRQLLAEMRRVRDHV
jgi:hypothetical protein